MSNRLKGFLFGAYSVIVAGTVLEAFFVLMLNAPRLTAASPAPVRKLIQQVYRHFDRKLIQFDPNCARYDPNLAYTLKPGVCTFENREFSTVVSVNRLGVRDDERSLDAPDVVVVGDSHAMGWGVDQDKTIARVVARRSGLKVLDAALSSYGTVREMRMLDRVDTSRMKVLMIQYSDNDMPENRTFRQDGDHLPIMSEAQYQNIVRYYLSQRVYYPGKYLYRLFMKMLRLEEPEPDQVQMVPISPSDEANLFVYVLVHGSHTPLNGVQVIVFEINEQLNPPRPFIAALERVKHDEANAPFVQQLATLDTTQVLTRQDFYSLDDHMNAHGHELVGEALVKLIRNR